jgi:hypothetical protein
MSRELTVSEIAELASQQGARAVAVENFLGSMPLSIGQSGNLLNLALDAESYHWNAQTRSAIGEGIRTAFASTVVKPKICCRTCGFAWRDVGQRACVECGGELEECRHADAVHEGEGE